MTEYVDNLCPHCKNAPRAFKESKEIRANAGVNIESKDLPDKGIRAYMHHNCGKTWEVPISQIRHHDAQL